MCTKNENNTLLATEKRKFICDVVVARMQAGVGAHNASDIALCAERCWNKIIKMGEEDNVQA